MAVQRMGSPTAAMPVVMVSEEPTPIGFPLELHAYWVEMVSLSASVVLAAHVSVVPTCTPELGVMLRSTNDGSRLLMVMVVVSVANPPLISVAVASQETVSPGAAIEESRVMLDPVPMEVVPESHANVSVMASPSASEETTVHVNVSVLYAGLGLIEELDIWGGVLSICTVARSETEALPSLTVAVQVTESPGERLVVERSSVALEPNEVLPLVHA